MSHDEIPDLISNISPTSLSTTTSDEEKDRKANTNPTYDKSESNENRFFTEAERDANRRNFPKGKPEGYYVTGHYVVPESGFENLVSNSKDSNGDQKGGITQEEVDRLRISGTNITLPIALMLLDAEVFPSLSRARKSCR